MNMNVLRQEIRRAALLVGALALVPASVLAQQADGASPQPQTQERQRGQGDGQGQGGGMRNNAPVPVIESGKWTGPRLRDGQPDVQGIYSNTQGNHSNFTRAGHSRVSDPADGQLPLQPWAEEKVKDFRANFSNPTQPQYVEPLARCAPAGVPKSFFWHGHEIRQFPGYVVILFDSGTRIIHLDGKPHLPANVKLWNADSRGHWEGNTLVVDVTNNNGKALFGRSGEFASENAHIAERWIFDNNGKRYNVVARVTDPEVYTRPWTATIPMNKRTLETDKLDNWHFWVAIANAPGKEKFVEWVEKICTENNGGFGFGGTAYPGPK